MIKIALCCIAKCENNYINEWCNYYINLGFDHIYIYDNNDKNYEFVGSRINKNILNKITIIDFSGDKSQIMAYNDCLKKYSNLYDYMAFFDIDEFLILKKHNNIKEILNNNKFKEYDAIRIHWIIYGDNDLVHRDINNSVLKDFYHEKNKKLDDIQSKCILNLKKVSLLKSVHGVYSENQCNIDLSKNTFNVTSNKSKNYNGIDTAFLAHFRTKTAEEYRVNIKRGHPRLLSERNKYKYKPSIEYFFKINKRTPEKEKILMENL